MTAVSRTANYKSSIMFLALTVGLGALIASSGDSWALQRDEFRAKCICACVYTKPNGFKVWSYINGTASGGFCGALDNQTCTYKDDTGTNRQAETSGCKPASNSPAAPAPGIFQPSKERARPRGVEGEPATTAPTGEKDKAPAPK